MMDIRAMVKKHLSLLLIAVGVLVFILVCVVCFVLLKGIAEVQDQKAQYVQGTVVARSMLDAKRVAVKRVPLTSAQEVASVLEALKALAAKHKLEVISIRADKPKVKENSVLYARIPLVLEVAAPFKDLGIFLSAVRDMPEGVLDVEEMVLRSENGKAQRVLARITLTLFAAKTNG